MDIRPLGTKGAPAAGLAASAATTDTSGTARSSQVHASEALAEAAPIPSPAELAQAVQNINKAMANMSLGLEFSVDSDNQRTIVKVIDQQTKEVIRQMPSEETLQIARTLDQVQGLLIKHKA